MEVQMEHASFVVKKALQYVDLYGFTTERAFCLLFDICVQNGGVNKTAPGYYNTHKGKNEKDNLKVMATAISKKSNPRWAADVLARKSCIATGSGKVHGTTRNLDKEFHLGDGPWAAQAFQAPKETPPADDPVKTGEGEQKEEGQKADSPST
jgi:hypothetical protein